MIKLVLNIIAFAMLIIAICIIADPDPKSGAAFAIWWLIGIVTAIGHIKWKRSVLPDKVKDKKVWIFYSWYSLNGPFLLVATLPFQIWHEYRKTTSSE